MCMNFLDPTLPSSIKQFILFPQNTRIFAQSQAFNYYCTVTHTYKTRAHKGKQNNPTTSQPPSHNQPNTSPSHIKPTHIPNHHPPPPKMSPPNHARRVKQRIQQKEKKARRNTIFTPSSSLQTARLPPHQKPRANRRHNLRTLPNLAALGTKAKAQIKIWRGQMPTKGVKWRG